MLEVGGNTPIIQAGGNDMMGGNWIWAFLLFALLGNNGFGNNNNGNQIYASQQFGQIDNAIRSIQNGICDTSFSLNNSIKDSMYNTSMSIQRLNNHLGDAICSQTYDLSNQIHGIGSKLDSWGCATQRSIDSVNFNMERNTNDIIQAGHSDTQRILDYLSCKELADKNQRIFEMSQRAQTLEIINAQKPQAPIPAYIQPSPYEIYYPAPAPANFRASTIA